jgi:hypothetical protein
MAVGAAGCASRNHAGGAGIIPTGAYVQQPSANGQSTVGYLDIRNNGAAAPARQIDRGSPFTS